MLKTANRLTASALGFGLVLLTSGCAFLEPQPRQITVSAKPVERPPLTLPTADKFISRPVEWIIITPENYQEVFDKIKSDGRPVVLFGITDKGYEHLALNLSDIRAFIQQQKAIIAAYENYYQQSQKAIDEANEQITKKEQASEESKESFFSKINPFD